MKSFVFSVFLSISLFSSLNAQFDRYDFVVVPTKFDVFFESNAYRTSTLLKFLLTEAGYDAYYEDELPEYALQNPCKGVKVDLEENSGLLLTKFQILFKDCRNQLVFKTYSGESKSKDYKTAYHQSIRQAFSSVLSGKGVSEPKKIDRASSVDRMRLMSNGGDDYSLVDYSGAVIFRLTKSAATDVYLVNAEEISGILFKNAEGKWTMELTDGSGAKVTTNPEIEW